MRKCSGCGRDLENVSALRDRRFIAEVFCDAPCRNRYLAGKKAAHLR